MRHAIPIMLALAAAGCSEGSGPSVGRSSPDSPATGEPLPATSSQPNPGPAPSEPTARSPFRESEIDTREPHAAHSPSSPALAEEPADTAVERCQGERDVQGCLVSALEGRDLRAQERQVLIEAYEALGDETKALEHMMRFVEDYPRDRRGNRYRIRLAAANID